jgi:DHA1 family tetracycline resistance protein-like MFS transporter
MVKSILQKLSKPFPTLVLINFTGALGFSIMTPFLVFLVHQWGGNALIYGLVGASYSIFQLIGSPILGKWSDVYGRKRILLASQIGTVLAWMLVIAAFYVSTDVILNVNSSLLGKFSITLPLILLLLSRSLDGLTGADTSVARAYLADITPEDQRDSRFGTMQVSSNMGYIIGPALAGILGASFLGYELPVLIAMAFSAVVVFLTFKMLPNSNPSDLSLKQPKTSSHEILGKEHKSCITENVKTKISTSEILKLPGIFVLLLIYFLVTLSFNFFYVAFPVQAATEMKWTVAHTGAFFSVMSIFMVLVQGPVLTYLSKIWSEKKLITVGAFVLGFGFLVLTPASNWLAFLGAVLIAIGNGLMWPPILTLMSKFGGSHQGAVQGLTGSVGASASILGLLVGGILYKDLKDWLFVLAAGLIFLIVVLLFQVKLKLKKTKY